MLLFGQATFFWILLVRQIMQYYDANPDKAPKPTLKSLIPSENLEPSSTTISPEEQMQIKDIFDLFDTDGGGSIDSDEMDSAMFALGFRPAPSKVKVQTESDNDAAKEVQSLTLEEFTALMKGEIMIASPLDAIWAAFSELSRSGDENQGSAQSCRKEKSRLPMDVVTLDGLKRACAEYDVKLSDEELKDMMDEADEDGGGYVDRNEFMTIMHNTPWF
jgi:Ca2+-binding EF-hand superfamily protein